MQDNNCVAVFYPELCLIHDCVTKTIKGVGKQKGGFYYLMDISPADLGKNVIGLCNKLVEHASLSQFESLTAAGATVNEKPNGYIWHLSKFQHIPCIPKMNGKLDCCLTCPLAKFIKLPQSLSTKHSPHPF